MAGLLSYLAAGAAKGVGTGMVETGRAKREAKMKELAHNRDMELRKQDQGHREKLASDKRKFDEEQGELNRQAARDRDATRYTHDATERDKDRTLRTDQGDKDRSFKSEEGEKGRAHDETMLGKKQTFAREQADRDNAARVEASRIKAEAGKSLTDDQKLQQARLAATVTSTNEFGVQTKNIDHDLMNKILKELGHDGIGEHRPSSGSSQSAEPSGSERTPPSDYPEARWSEKAGGWVVQRGGRWYKVD